MDLSYHVNECVEVSEAINLLKRSELKRPDEDAHRLVRIVPQANIVVTARDGRKLVGIARGLHDVSGCCYLSDLVVDTQYRDQAVGEQLIRQVRKAVGDNSLIVLVPAPDAMAYSAELE